MVTLLHNAQQYNHMTTAALRASSMLVNTANNYQNSSV